MNRSKLLILIAACCLLSFVAVAGATEVTPAAGASYCNKLCIIGYHCVPTPDGGKCVKGGVAEAETTATLTADSTSTNAGSYCDKLCIIGYHCVPTHDGGKCVKGN